MALFDLKALGSALDELEQERGVSRASVLDAIETALAAAYRREYGKRGQIIRATFNPETGEAEFRQAKIVVDKSLVRGEEEEPRDEDDDRSRFNPEQHIMLEDAQKIRKDAQVDDEISFPLESKDDFGRIAAQAAKQVILQKIREAERMSIMHEFGEREGEIVTGHVQRFERGNLYIDLGRATGILPYDEQIPGERYRQGERIRALLFRVDEGARGTFLKLSRSHPHFLVKLFESEVPEMANGTVEMKAIVREPGARAKIAVTSNDEHIDPVGSLVGQRGVRVAVVMEALKPAEVLDIELFEDEHRAVVQVAEDQQSLAIGRGGQNVRLAARLTGWKIDIRSTAGEEVAKADEEGVEIADATMLPEIETVDATIENAEEAQEKEGTEKAGEDETDAAPDIHDATDTDPKDKGGEEAERVDDEAEKPKAV
jgi:N utilization substance protein A